MGWWKTPELRKTHATVSPGDPGGIGLARVLLPFPFVHPDEKTLASRTPNIPCAAAILAAALLAAACDRPLARAASAAETLPPPAADGAPPAPAAKDAAPRARAPAPDPLSDAAITARVASGIRGDPALAGTDLTVNTSRGVVSLTGTVQSPEQVAEATARAQAPDGVVRLDTHVSVVPP